ncbi:hypothetical protein, partial [Leclercia adecarboxylata]|uniref:hypothetical protein n=1 Tax=Leclercia adecarboxylata TaxID=83655 RepID=UPI00234D9DBD
MAKKSDAKRKAKLKERQKRFAAAESRVSVMQGDPQGSVETFDAAPYVVVSLLDDSGTMAARIEGDYGGEDWKLIADEIAVAGSSDEFLVLGLLLGLAVDRHSPGQLLEFSPWMIEEIDKRCDALN